MICQKDRLDLNFLDFESHFSAELQVQISDQGLIRIVFTRGELFG